MAQNVQFKIMNGPVVWIMGDELIAPNPSRFCVQFPTSAREEETIAVQQIPGIVMTKEQVRRCALKVRYAFAMTIPLIINLLFPQSSTAFYLF